MLLVPDKEHKKVFPNVPVAGFRNGKRLQDYLVRAALPRTNETRRYEPCGKNTCLVCNSTGATTTFTRFRYRLNNYKRKHRAFRKGNREIPKKLFNVHYCLDGNVWDFIISEQ